MWTEPEGRKPNPTSTHLHSAIGKIAWAEAHTALHNGAYGLARIYLACKRLRQRALITTRRSQHRSFSCNRRPTPA